MNHDDILGKLLIDTEHKFNYGNKENWVNRHFIMLSDDIFNKTKERISVNTLKRLYNKQTYNQSSREKSLPHTATLDVIAKYLGYSGWLNFFNTYKTCNTIEYKEIKINSTKRTKNKFFVVFSVLFSLAIIICLFLFLKPHSLPTYKITGDDVSGFYPKKVKVTFECKPKNKKHFSASFYCYDQTLKKNRFFPVELKENNNYYTKVYDYPGFYFFKLNYKNKTIDSIPIIIYSKNWFAHIIDINGIRPVLDFIYNDSLYVKTTYFSEDINKLKYFTLFQYINNFNISSDNFNFSVILKNSFKTGGLPHYNTKIRIVGDNLSVINIEFCEPDGATNLIHDISEKNISGTRNNLKLFERDLSKWSKIEINNKNKKVSVFFNGDSITTYTYNNSLGMLSGLGIKFLGNGCINYVCLKDSANKVVFEDDKFEFKK